MTTDSNALIDQVLDIQLHLTSPTTRVVLVGPHILYIDSSSGKILNLRRPKVLNKLLRESNLMTFNEQMTDAMHYAFVRTIEDDGEYLEANLQQRGMLGEYRELLDAMPSIRNTGKLILQLIKQNDIYVLSPEGDPEVELKNWMYELPVDIENQWDSFEAFEPRVP